MTTDNTGNDDNPSENNEKRIFRIAVGSSNPCKVDAVRQALQRAIEFSSGLDVDLEVEGFSVGSDVPDQPFGDVSQWFKKLKKMGRLQFPPSRPMILLNRLSLLCCFYYM
jgi:hypothetical protein